MFCIRRRLLTMWSLCTFFSIASYRIFSYIQTISKQSACEIGLLPFASSNCEIILFNSYVFVLNYMYIHRRNENHSLAFGWFFMQLCYKIDFSKAESFVFPVDTWLKSGLHVVFYKCYKIYRFSRILGNPKVCESRPPPPPPLYFHFFLYCGWNFAKLKFWENLQKHALHNIQKLCSKVNPEPPPPPCCKSVYLLFATCPVVFAGQIGLFDLWLMWLLETRPSSFVYLLFLTSLHCFWRQQQCVVGAVFLGVLFMFCFCFVLVFAKNTVLFGLAG